MRTNKRDREKWCVEFQRSGAYWAERAAHQLSVGDKRNVSYCQREAAEFYRLARRQLGLLLGSTEL